MYFHSSFIPVSFVTSFVRHPSDTVTQRIGRRRTNIVTKGGINIKWRPITTPVPFNLRINLHRSVLSLITDQDHVNAMIHDPVCSPACLSQIFVVGPIEYYIQSRIPQENWLASLRATSCSMRKSRQLRLDRKIIAKQKNKTENILRTFRVENLFQRNIFSVLKFSFLFLP